MELYFLGKDMRQLELSIFSFDSRLDFQSGYVRQTLCYTQQSTLKDILQQINPKLFGYQEFGVDRDFIHFRINDIAIFGNLYIDELVSKFGYSWVIDPLNKRYAKKDLLLNIDMTFTKYQSFFQTMRFIAPSEQAELKKYIPINFIATCHDDEYCGDGFLLYIQWLIMRYPLYKKTLLQSIAHVNGGIFEHVCVANCLFPANNAIDLQIEALQHELLNSSKTFVQKEWIAFGQNIVKQYPFECKNVIMSDNTTSYPTNFMQNILAHNIEHK